MKTPLRYQMTEYDCGPTSLENAFIYLLEREEIPLELIRAIFLYTLDSPNEDGKVGYQGTSVHAMNFFTQWFSNYITKVDIGVGCIHLEKEDVTLSTLEEWLRNNGVVIVRTYLEGEHYVLLTKIEEDKAYIWDPYYLESKEDEEDIEIILAQSLKYNRIVSLKHFQSIIQNNLSLGPIESRECLLIRKK